MSERTPLTHPESPWLWVMLSGGSIALHGLLLLVLSRPALQFQPSSVTATGNWVPITLWSATAAPASAPKLPTQEPPVPIAPQTTAPPQPQATPSPQSQPPSPTPTPSPQAKPKPNPSPTSQPTPSPQPKPTPSPTPNPPPNQAEVNEDGTSLQGEQPERNNSDESNDSSTQTEQTDGASSNSGAFAVAPLGFKNLCLSGAPDCIAPIDAPAQPLQEPTSEEIKIVLEELGLQLTETIKIQTAIDVKIDGIAEVVINQNLTQVLQSNLNPSKAELLAAKLMQFYRFAPPLLQGVPKRHDYTVILTITPS